MSEKIYRIPEHYINREFGCAQVMLPYRDTFTLFDKNGIIFNKSLTYDFINAYLTDERRKYFPYSNIPNHIKREDFFKRINLTNQLLNFDEHYISICDGVAVDRCVLLDNNSALMLTKFLPYRTEDENEFSNTTKYMNRQELDNMFRAKKDINGSEKVFIATTGGHIYHSDSMGYLEEDVLLEHRKEEFTREFDRHRHSYSHGTCEFFERKINEMTVDDLIDYWLSPELYLIKMDGENITIQLISTILVKKDEYKVTIKNIPLDKYVLEQFKYMSSSIVELKEPRISLRLNPGITRSDIRNEKDRVLSMKR